MQLDVSVGVAIGGLVGLGRPEEVRVFGGAFAGGFDALGVAVGVLDALALGWLAGWTGSGDSALEPQPAVGAITTRASTAAMAS
jgi:hypothetical protein